MNGIFIVYLENKISFKSTTIGRYSLLQILSFMFKLSSLKLNIDIDANTANWYIFFFIQSINPIPILLLKIIQKFKSNIIANN